MNELSKSLRAIVMRNGIEIWLESDRVEKLQETLKNLTANKFIKIDERTLNTADMLGIFTSQDMEDLKRRKNGEWQDKKGNWRARGEVETDFSESRREVERLRKLNPIKEIQ